MVRLKVFYPELCSAPPSILSARDTTHYLKASNTEANDLFGQSLALSGDTVAAGAVSEASSATGVNGNQADNGAPTSGAAYVLAGIGPLVLGDANCDGVLNAADVGPFVQALVDPAGYAAAFPGCPPEAWEPDDNGQLDGDDAASFVALLLGL